MDRGRFTGFDRDLWHEHQPNIVTSYNIMCTLLVEFVKTNFFCTVFRVFDMTVLKYKTKYFGFTFGFFFSTKCVYRIEARYARHSRCVVDWDESFSRATKILLSWWTNYNSRWIQMVCVNWLYTWLWVKHKLKNSTMYMNRYACKIFVRHGC